MEDFLKDMLNGIENNMKSCALNNESIKKPFDQIYDTVREDPKGISSFEEYKAKRKKILKNLKMIYVNGEKAVYDEVIKEFLKQHPELGQDFKEK